MRCASWPDDRCRSPNSCDGFGYCRQRNWDHQGIRIADTTPFVKNWRKMDDDGKLAGNLYREITAGYNPKDGAA